VMEGTIIVLRFYEQKQTVVENNFIYTYIVGTLMGSKTNNNNNRHQ